VAPEVAEAAVVASLATNVATVARDVTRLGSVRRNGTSRHM
jgi:hypothetical protein